MILTPPKKKKTVNERAMELQWPFFPTNFVIVLTKKKKGGKFSILKLLLFFFSSMNLNDFAEKI